MSTTPRRPWAILTVVVALGTAGMSACGSSSNGDGGATVNTDEGTSPSTTSTSSSTESSTASTISTTDPVTTGPVTTGPMTTGPVPTDPATTPLSASDVPVVQYRVQGLFPVIPPFLPNGWTTIYADGTVLAPFGGDAFAQPQVWPYELGRVGPARVEQLIAMAAASGLLGAPMVSEPPYPTHISDPARTSVIITTTDATYPHSIDGMTTAGAETDEYRRAVQLFVGAITTLVMDAVRAAQDGSGASNFHQPLALDVLALDVTDAAPGPGPATVVPWTPTDVELASLTSCTVVTAAEAIAFLKSNLAGPTYEQHGRQFRVVSRVHPPGTSCGG